MYYTTRSARTIKCARVFTITPLNPDGILFPSLRPRTGAIRRHHGARVPAAVHRVQLPEGVRLVDRHARRHVPVPVQRILPVHVQGETGPGKCGDERNAHFQLRA